MMSGLQTQKIMPKRSSETVTQKTLASANLSSIVGEVLRSPSQPLDADMRTFMQSRFGHHLSNVSIHPVNNSATDSSLSISQPGDVSEQEADHVAEYILRNPENVAAGNSVGADLDRVRIHSDSHAAQMSQALNAAAFTFGNDIYFNRGRYAPSGKDGRALLAHELTHVAQQTASGLPSLQRQLLLTGSQNSLDDFIAMCETASGLVLTRNALTNQVTAIGSRAAPATSPAFGGRLTDIIDDPHQNAEIHVGRDQPNVDIGAFPTPSDLTAGGVQNVDMDDINAMEAGAPGIGVADLLHEISENYEAHAHRPAAGVDLFPAAHQEGLQAEAEVVTDIVGSGRRVAQASQATGANTTRIAEDYNTYYVLSTLTNVAATHGFSRSNASFAPKVNVQTQTIDQFGSNDNTVPPTGAPIIAAIAGALTANPLATVRIEGFTDNQGAAGFNRDLGSRRAEDAAGDLVAAGVDGGRIQIVGRGAVSFVTPNDTEAHRAQNRRVVITVTRPGP